MALIHGVIVYPMNTQKQTTKPWEEAYKKALLAGTSTSTRRAYTRDINYYWVWAKTRLRRRHSRYPIRVDDAMTFILDHTGSMPQKVQKALVEAGFRKGTGPLKVSTIKRYLASLSVAHNEAGKPSPMLDDRVKLLLRRLRNANANEAAQKKQAITSEILKQMLAVCDKTLTGKRDKALLMLGFASGGRRRSELANLMVSDLKRIKSGYVLRLRKSKTDQAGNGLEVPLLGKAATALSDWLVASGIREGKLFRGIKANGALYEGISGQTINRIIKRYVSKLGYDPAEYGAHSLRAGFITEAGRRGLPLGESMMLSGHRSVNVAHGYYREGELLSNPSAHLLD